MTFLGLSKDFNQYGGSQNNSNEVTAKELLDLVMGGNGGIFAGSFPDGLAGVLKHNIRDNAFQMATAAVVTPIAFKVGKQLLSKPIIRPLNKVIKMAGVTGVRV